MYKCTICNKEYQVKPDFCDCGNDEFESFGSEKEIVKNEIQKQEIWQETPYKPDKKIEKGDIISIIIFSICVLFSLWFLLFFGGGGDKTINAPESKQTINETKSIPDINSIWDDSPNKTIQPVQVAVIKKEEVKPKISKTKQIAPLIQPKVQNKTVAPASKSAPKQISQPVSQPSPIQAAPVQSTVQKPQTVDIEAQKQELKNYKIALRNKIAQGINFASVAGDGVCSVTFSISNSGSLVGRKFSKLSENDMLNQAVFQALSNVTSFYPPPVLYKGETLTLTVKFYDGNFSVALP